MKAKILQFPKTEAERVERHEAINFREALLELSKIITIDDEQTERILKTLKELEE